MNKNTLLLKKFLKDTSIVNKPRTHPSPDWNFQQIETFHQTYKLNSTLDKYPRSFIISLYENTKKKKLTIRIAIHTWQTYSIFKTPTLTILPVLENTARISFFPIGIAFTQQVARMDTWKSRRHCRARRRMKIGAVRNFQSRGCAVLWTLGA